MSILVSVKQPLEPSSSGANAEWFLLLVRRIMLIGLCWWYAWHPCGRA